ncbi:MAG: acyltransferase family protein, partial [Firmicutes bacterium]|nr:acyltransferase family protein [Bacillota bacterium]
MERTNAPKLNPQNRRYASIDAARFFCALLVVAIHVRPLETYTELGNFLLDKGLCRIAVPFFFLVSGFFWARKPMTVKSLGKFLG